MTKMKDDNPWRIKSKRQVYDNPWIRVYDHKVLDPSGGDGIYGTIHFKNLAIGIIPIDNDWNSWIVGQYRFPLRSYSWEIPEGGGKHNVTPLESAKRELLEETGIKAENWHELMKIHTSNSVSDEVGIIFIAKNLSFFKSQPDKNEELVIKKVPFEDLVKKVMKGEITDSLSVAGILKTKILRDQGLI